MSAIVNSALWAAYGDALGFITELVDAKAVKRRIGSGTVRETVPWSRQVSRRFGPTVDLPAGCYSDDTQLRLAVSRAITAEGGFDAEAFSKIELTVWPAYALGAGRGSKEAARHLARREITWATNFYDGKQIYVNGGGNGAAMRVQPHIWAAPVGQRNARGVLRQVFVDSVATHGHPRGIIGALFHALCVAYALEEQTSPDLDALMSFAERLRESGSLLSGNEQLSDVWAPQWEQTAKQDVVAGLRGAAEEVLDDLRGLPKLGLGDVKAYRNALDLLGARQEMQRGSATKTAVAAAVCAWIFRAEPQHGLAVCANELGTDTDSIATMAGALLGAHADHEPEAAIADRHYITANAQRLSDISRGSPVLDTAYPDLLRWVPPKVQLDAVGQVGGDLAVRGLGMATPDGEPQSEPKKNGPIWQWLELEWGQQILAKRRPSPPELGPDSLPAPPGPPRSRRRAPKASSAPEQRPTEVRGETQAALFEVSPPPPPPDSHPPLERLMKDIVASEFDDAVVGRALNAVAGEQGSAASAMALVGMIVQAQRDRRGS